MYSNTTGLQDKLIRDAEEIGETVQGLIDIIAEFDAKLDCWEEAAGTSDPEAAEELIQSLRDENESLRVEIAELKKGQE